jgi:hypothetical protein
MLDVLGSGSRWLRDRALVWRCWDEVGERFGDFVLRHGKCPTGFDALAQEWADARGVVTDPMPADWDSCGWECPTTPHRRRKRPGDVVHPGMLDDYCPYAGPRRNAAMVAKGAALLVAAPEAGGLGTQNCIRLAKAARMPVWDITRPGSRPW